MKESWIPIYVEYDELENDKNKIYEIIYSKKPAIVIRNFYDRKLCSKIVNNTKNFSKEPVENKIIKKIGISLLSYLTKKPEYFSEAEKARNVLRTLFNGMEDPRIKIHNLLSKVFPDSDVSIATEDGKKYACGIIRIHGKGDFAQIHRDCVSYEAPNFGVSKFTDQLSTVLYLQQSEEGGELIIYEKSWKKSDEKFREISFGYSNKVLKDCKKSSIIKPRQGDLIILNPINYHEILPVKGIKQRVTLGLFFAFSNINKKIVTWS